MSALYGTYARSPLAFERGEGVRLISQDGTRYLDFHAGIAVNALGYADPHLVEGDLRFEPASALVAGVDGLDDLRLIVAQAPDHLEAGGWLMLEHGYDQAEAVRDLLLTRGFEEVHSRSDLGGHQRISLGRLPC